MSELDAKDLRAAFGSYMTGVTVVTACAEDGSLVGFTANSFTSVSLDPPLLLVCPGKHLSSLPVFNHVVHFAVNVLAEGQEQVSNVFASSSDKRFEQVSWQADEHGSPILQNVAATFSCEVHQRVTAGDHVILIGRVTGFSRTEQLGLGYYSGGYFSLQKERQAETITNTGTVSIAGALIEHDERLLVKTEKDGLSLPAIKLDAKTGARSALKRYLSSQGLNVTVGPVYSIYDDVERNEHFTFFKTTALAGNTGDIGEYVPVSSLSSRVFVDTAQQHMVERFVREFRTRVFGLYIGSSHSGEVHLDE